MQCKPPVFTKIVTQKNSDKRSNCKDSDQHQEKKQRIIKVQQEVAKPELIPDLKG
jgi:hypothetical protein